MYFKKYACVPLISKGRIFLYNIVKLIIKTYFITIKSLYYYPYRKYIYTEYKRRQYWYKDNLL